MNVQADTSIDLDVKELLERLKRHVSPAGNFLMKRVEDEVNTISTELVAFKAAAVVVAAPTFNAPVEQRLTATQARLFALLQKAGERGVTSEGLGRAMYANRPDCDQPEDPPGLIKVHVHHMRRRLQGTGYAIETIWGRGFRLREPMAQAA